MKPKYLARTTDGSVLKCNHNGTYSFVDSKMSNPHEYTLEMLPEPYFEVVTEADFPRLKEKGDLYYEWLSWTTRPDGHGGSKGGDFEEFMIYKNKFVDTTK